jgi:two-component system, NtrC family, sensor histidine kinase HydH
MSLDEIRSNEARMDRRFLIMTFVMIAIGLLVLASLIVEKKYRRMQEEMRRREKSAAMGDLAAGVAHEIRNPLNAIGMIVQRLEREFEPAAGAEEYRSLTSVMKRETARVNAIIHQFLSFARPAPPQPAPVDIAQFVSHVAVLFGEQSRAKNIDFTSDCRTKGMWSLDAGRMTQAILNLLQNALDATPDGGRIRLSVAGDNSHLIFIVSDTGKGIPPENMNRIFDLYFTTRANGTGLGLAITQQIVSQHGGSIQVESNPDKGSLFTIILPHRK